MQLHSPLSKTKVLLALIATVSFSAAKKTYQLEEKPMLKAPSVQKYDCRNCIFDDGVNFWCLEHSIDVKAGWEIKQRWEIATDINPVAVTPIAAPGFVYLAPDIVTKVGYKYKIRFQPYTEMSFNARPNIKVDRLFMQEMQFNIDKFKSLFYFELVYYQNAVKYTYTGTKPPS